MSRGEIIERVCLSDHIRECIYYDERHCDECSELVGKWLDEYKASVIEECARTIEISKTLFENHQTATIMLTKDKCIAMIRNLKEQT